MIIIVWLISLLVLTIVIGEIRLSALKKQRKLRNKRIIELIENYEKECMR